MLESLTSTAENVQNAEPISAHPGKIREQMEENKVGRRDMVHKGVEVFRSMAD